MADQQSDEAGEEPPPRRLRSIQLKGLLGQYDHEIQLDPEQPTILTGANGTGKSTVLRLINAVAQGAWHEFARIPFSSAVLDFGPHQKLKITKTAQKLTLALGNRGYLFDLNDLENIAELDPGSWAKPSPEDRGRDYARHVSTRAPTQGEHPSSPSEWAHRRKIMQGQMTLEEMESELDDWVRELSESFEVRLVSDRRLYAPGNRRGRGSGPGGREPARDVVSECSRELGRLISVWLSRYAAASQREDRQFPLQVADAIAEAAEIDEGAINELINRVTKRRDALERVGLAGRDQEPDPSFDRSKLKYPAVAVVVKTFAEVTLRKFDVLEPLRERLALFIDFLDDHFAGKQAHTRDPRATRAPRHLRDDDTWEGLVFELPNSDELNATQLSSGEQQLLVLAYEILFETPEGTLLLIDEPELSLHVGWQRTFIDDIAALGRPRKIQFLLATHSPTLIGGRSDSRYSLDPQP